MSRKIRLECAAGHAQEIAFGDETPREAVESYAALLDGTSVLFAGSALEEMHSVIGKCSWLGCGQPFRASVVDVTLRPIAFEDTTPT